MSICDDARQALGASQIPFFDRTYTAQAYMEIRQLRYFLTAAEQGSVAAASRLLHVAQPALSRQISAMEDQLGTRLFDRLPRGVALTRAGREFVLRATRIVDDLQNLKHQSLPPPRVGWARCMSG